MPAELDDGRLVIRLSSTYPLERIERLLRDLRPLIDAEEPIAFVLDLRGLVWAGPTSLAVLTAVVNRVKTMGLIAPGSTLRPPVSPQVGTYLLRMDVLAHMFDPEQFEGMIQRHEAVAFRPCMRFETDQQHQDVVRHLSEAMAESVETDRIGRWSLNACLSEMCENVLHHAESPTGGFAVAQSYPKRERAEIAIVDVGQGIRGSLTKRAEYADIDDDVRAIEMALEQRVTATPERNAGLGLFITRHLLRANGGKLVVRSGDGGVYDGADAHTEQHDVSYPGTIVSLVARTDRPLDMGSVYRSLGFGLD